MMEISSHKRVHGIRYALLSAKASRKYCLLSVLKNVGLFVCSLCLSWAIVNAYTVTHHGQFLSLKKVLVPGALSKSKVLWNARNLLRNPFSIYWIMIVVMCGTICCCIFELVRIQLSETKMVMFLAASMGLGLFTYYMQDPFWNKWTILLFEFLFLCSFFWIGLFVTGIKEKRMYHYLTEKQPAAGDSAYF